MRTIRLALAAALALGCPVAASADTWDVTVGPGNLFAPANLTIQAGDVVRWTNTGAIHNVVADDGSFTSGEPSGGAWVFSHTFPSAGSFPYHCSLHGAPGGVGMAGVVTVQGGGGGSPGSLRFSSAGYSVSETGGAATITVERVGGDDGAVSVQYATANGSAQAGSDYLATSGTLDWASGDDDARTFQVQILDDSLDEANETVQLSLSNPTGGAVLGSPAAATLTIVDDDEPAGSPGTLRFAAGAVSVSEGADMVSLTVVRDGGAIGAVSAQLTTADGTAVAGSDYVAFGQPVVFGDGDATAKVVHVMLIDDAIEESAETFSATLSAPSGGASLGSPSTATVTITDDDVSPICVADDHTLCLNQDRFRVRVTWVDFQGGTGQAFALPYTADSGFFYFFGPDNLEVLVKVLDACVPFERYWVFFAVASNVEYHIEVADTHHGLSKVYDNPPGVFAPATGDTDAFATCP
ncbi:MAG: hypothetical protein KJ058_00390 [Thermoanaerobaculia bacterium]|nr:hypothetical protein [Thermoanaerobaculia bacterium]